MPAPKASTWTIPLQVSVSVGTPLAGLDEAASAATSRAFVEGRFGAPEEDAFEVAAGRFSLEALGREGFSWPTALDAALCSDLAYRADAEVRAIARTRWGFEDCRPVAAGSTEGFVASAAEAVVVAFRGTQQTADWLVNLDVGWTVSRYGHVHRGFHGAFQSVRGRLEEAMAVAQAGRKAVVLAGHSLGGALATLAAAEWHGRFPIAGVYTFGQPAVGFTNFRSFLDVRYPGTFHRFVNDDDVVARVPPGYRHVGKLYHFTGGGRVGHEGLGTPASDGETPTMGRAEFEQLKARLQAARSVAPAAMNESRRSNAFQEGFFPSVADHSLSRYIRQILRQLG